MAWSASGSGAIDAHHPLALGLVARNGPYQANHAARTADVLLALGVRFDDRTSSSWLPGYSFTIPPTKLIHVDIDPEEIGRTIPSRSVLWRMCARSCANCWRSLMRTAMWSMAPRSRSAWLATIEGYRKNGMTLSPLGETTTARQSIPSALPHEIDRALPADAIMVSDIGVHHNWLLQFCNPRGPHSLIGSMGFGADGVWRRRRSGGEFAAPDRPCVSVCGDGAFFMHASVLGTAVEYSLPVVWVVWNNFAYASIRGLQRGYLGGRELPTEFRHPDTGAPYNPDLPPWRDPPESTGSTSIAPAIFRRRCELPLWQGARRSSTRASEPTPIRAAQEFGSFLIGSKRARLRRQAST